MRGINVKKFGVTIIITGLIFFMSISFSTIIESFYFEVSDYAFTQTILLSLIFTIIFCTLTILEEFKKIRVDIDNNKDNKS